MKTFIKNRDFRSIPVGYSAVSVNEYRLSTGLYFNCGEDELARIDMFGVNDYSWCGDASMTTSQYSQQMKDFANYTVPLFFSEFGCNSVLPRPFTEIQAIYSTDMSSVFSGGLVYEYSEEASNYGLVELSGDSVSTNDDFDNLKKQFNKTSNPSGDGGYLDESGPNNCPSLSSDWNVTEDIPDAPKGALKYLKGLVEPTGHGFDAYVQSNCHAADNNVDDSGNYTSTVAGSTHTSPDETSSLQTGATSTGASTTSASSTKNDGDMVASSGLLSVIALAAGFALI